ncbi:F-box/LRR-repeat protein At3g59200-like isoform X2 [Vicia villosa]|uniref:F-box/LRR-repeat protein At3g59200-like isoform X2 n=1 Tax=Vicia villosa TaxID=3911 RepID=UPI00273C1869|nr:F-box/LRR-repeat protein At3g59200-like isoform X2 [Vicia villosa]
MENLILQPPHGTKENTNKRLKSVASQSLIEDLPDEILSEILYWLNTKLAFETCLVSKRWYRLFHSLDFFFFTDAGVNCAENRVDLLRFVNSVIFSPHYQHLPIKHFILDFQFQIWDADDHITFNQWVEAAKRRRVSDLDLHLINVPLAPSIFCFKTLIKLRLIGISIGTLLHSSVDLPLLKSLYMHTVTFHNREDSMKLVSGCPQLKRLIAMFISVSNESVTAGYYKPLSNLFESAIWLFEVPFNAVYNVLCLGLLGLGRNVANIETSSYYKDFPVFGNLTELYLTWSYNADLHEWDEQSSPNKEDWKYPYQVPQCLSSHLTKCDIQRYEPLEADFRFATYILQNALHLQVMTIGVLRPEPTESPHFVDDLFSSSRISPACQLSISDLQLPDLVL